MDRPEGDWPVVRTSGFSTNTHSMEVQTVGVLRYTMYGPYGTDYPNEVRSKAGGLPDRIIYTTSVRSRRRRHHTHRVIVEFREKGTKTEVSTRMIFPSAVERDQVVKVYGARRNGTIRSIGWASIATALVTNLSRRRDEHGALMTRVSW
jgi:hypothetical protein